jgi:GAF domain-containing protein
MDTIVRLIGAERGFLMLRDRQGALSIRVARNWEQESLNDSETAISRTVVNQVIANGQPVLTTNARQDPRFGRQESVIAHSLRSILCVPLRFRDRVIGVIYADNRFRSGLSRRLTVTCWQLFANQAAVAIENACCSNPCGVPGEVSEMKNLLDDVLASIASG